MKKRAAGVLLHISSLPSEYGIGDFGPSAYKFVDFLVQSAQTYWQILPLNPLMPVDENYSPYNGASVFAGNTLFISPQLLYRQGLINKNDIRNKPAFPETRVNYRLVASFKNKLFDIAYENFERCGKPPAYQQFCTENKSWLEDYSIFVSLHRHFHNQSWLKWPTELREHKKSALKSVRTQLAQSINRDKFLQYIFLKQWQDLKNYCQEHNISVIGDIPFYVAFESSDVWTNPGIFKLTKERKLRFVAGVPPDAFSRTGQLWNNPVYDWNILKKTGYQWWLARIRHNLNLFDIVRLDHFRGFAAYWQIPAGRRDAIKGKWIIGPREDFLKKIFARFPVSSFIAEDLGRITGDVRELMKKSQLAGTRVLLFAFGKNPESSHCPQNYLGNSVVYTGTHDNNTIRGWFGNEADAEQKKKLFDFLGGRVSASQLHWQLIRLAACSVCDTVIVPMQDILGLGEEARMNRPATIKDNWQWRLSGKALKPSIAKRLRKLTETYGRV